jgi:CRISPR-associated protein Csb1
VADDAKKKGTVRPSEVNHGSVPFDGPNAGTTIAYAEQITTLSLICLRRLRFPLNGGNPDAAVDAAGQTALAALGLCAATLAFESGMGLRSRCLLWPEGPMTWELLEKPGVHPRLFLLDKRVACQLLGEAVSAAEKRKLHWLPEPLILKPSNELLKLVRLSQIQAVSEGVEMED